LCSKQIQSSKISRKECSIWGDVQKAFTPTTITTATLSPQNHVKIKKYFISWEKKSLKRILFLRGPWRDVCFDQRLVWRNVLKGREKIASGWTQRLSNYPFCPQNCAQSASPTPPPPPFGHIRYYPQLGLSSYISGVALSHCRSRLKWNPWSQLPLYCGWNSF